jgi:hypothetical protein
VSRVPDGRLTPRQTGRLTVGRNVTSCVMHHHQNPLYLTVHNSMFNMIKGQNFHRRDVFMRSRNKQQ